MSLDILPRIAIPHETVEEASKSPNYADTIQSERDIPHTAPVAEKSNPQKLNLFRKVKTFFSHSENIQLFACYWALAAAGWIDASTGPLIPYIEEYYGLTYTVVSTIFISQCAGSLAAGLLNNRMTDRFGMGRCLTIGAVLQLLGYCVVIAPPPFPVFPPAFILIGLGGAWQDAGSNAFVAGLSNASQKLGYLHGAYGLGATAAPLVATAFVQQGLLWSRFFCVSLGFTLSNVLILYTTFCRTPIAKADSTHNVAEDIQLAVVRTREEDAASDVLSGRPATAAVDSVFSTSAKDWLILTSKVNWLVACFLTLYVGCEVSLGGWIVAYLVDVRDGGVSAGYVSSGFWGGLAVSRLILPRFNLYVGEKRVIYLYIILAVLLEVSIWLWHSIIGNAVAFSLVGFLLGPVYPCAISILTKIMPKHLHADKLKSYTRCRRCLTLALLIRAVGLVASVGSAGAAVFPFVTGALASRYGTWVLQPMVISLLAAMAVLWVLIPTPARRLD